MLYPPLSETFSFPLTESIVTHVTKNTNTFAKEENSITKTTPAKDESFLMTLSDINKTGRIVFTKLQYAHV